MNNIKLKKLHPDAIMPTKGDPDAACYDLYALEDVDFGPGEIKLVRTGWAMEAPKGWRFNLYVRSSTPLKKYFSLANGVGIIDWSYRGECMVQLMNIKVDNQRIYANDPQDKYGEFDQRIRIFTENRIRKGDKIAQIELVLSISANLEVVDELSNTERGTGGFGSTGN